MRGSTSVDGNTSEPRRSKRQRIDLTSEEGFDRHELERALLKSLEEERSREKDKPIKKTNRSKANKSEATASVVPRKRKVEEPSPKAGKSAKKEEKEEKRGEQTSATSRKAVEAEQVVLKKPKIASVVKGKEDCSTQNSSQGTSAKKQSTVKKRDIPLKTKKEEVEVVVAEGSSKSDDSTVKEPKPATTGLAADRKTDSKEKERSVEAGDSQKTKAEAEVRRLPPPYRLPSRASDLITLLACAKEVLGDHEYSSDQD